MLRSRGGWASPNPALQLAQKRATGTLATPQRGQIITFVCCAVLFWVTLVPVGERVCPATGCVWTLSPCPEGWMEGIGTGTAPYSSHPHPCSLCC